MASRKAMRNGCILEKLPVDFAAMHTVLHVYDSHSAIKEWFKGDISWGQNLPKTLVFVPPRNADNQFGITLELSNVFSNFLW